MQTLLHKIFAYYYDLISCLDRKTCFAQLCYCLKTALNVILICTRYQTKRKLTKICLDAKHELLSYQYEKGFKTKAYKQQYCIYECFHPVSGADLEPGSKPQVSVHMNVMVTIVMTRSVCNSRRI